MAMATQEQRQFQDLVKRVELLEREITHLRDRANEQHGTISYLKGLLKPATVQKVSPGAKPITLE